MHFLLKLKPWKQSKFKKDIRYVGNDVVLCCNGSSIWPEGVWDYEVEIPDGTVTGEMAVTKAEAGFDVVI